MIGSALEICAMRWRIFASLDCFRFSCIPDYTTRVGRAGVRNKNSVSQEDGTIDYIHSTPIIGIVKHRPDGTVSRTCHQDGVHVGGKRRQQKNEHGETMVKREGESTKKDTYPFYTLWIVD